MLALIVLSLVASVLNNLHVLKVAEIRSRASIGDAYEDGVIEGVRLSCTNRANRNKVGKGLAALIPVSRTINYR